MQQAILLAQKAEAQGEVPVGALIVKDNEIVGEGFNQPIQSHDPTAHAEIIALINAAKNTQNYRLMGTTLYVTLEPCLMCVGAMQHARIEALVFGATDPKLGYFSKNSGAQGNLRVTGGICETDCSALLKAFFQQRRV